MRLRGHEQGLRWLLLCLLLLGVVSMHHFMPPAGHEQPPAAMTGMIAPSAHGGDPMQQPASPAPDQGHDLLHLCMAVLGAVIGLLLIALLLTTSWPDRSLLRRRPPVSWRADWPPGPSGRTLLSSVCVLRL